jgi:hypothetical protein
MPKPKALLIAYAVHESGVREVIGLDVGEVESGAFYVEFSRSLHKRGLGGVRLAISDQHEGLNGTIARVLKVSVAALRRPVHQRHDVAKGGACDQAFGPPDADAPRPAKTGRTAVESTRHTSPSA